MKLKHIVFSLLMIFILSITALAVNPPEITGSVGLRIKEPLGFRVKAVIDSESAEHKDTLEYGFIITRKVFLVGNGLSNEDFTLDCRAYYTKGVSKGVVDGEEIDIFYDRDDTQVIFTGHLYGITPYYYTDIIVARPYIITTEEKLYGEPVEMSLYEVAKGIKNDAELYSSLDEEQKNAVDSIIIYVDGEPYEINGEDYRIVLSSTIVKNANPTYSISYDLYNPFTGETTLRVPGRKSVKDSSILTSMLPESGALVPVYDGLVQDTTDGYMAECLPENLLWVKSLDAGEGSISLIPYNAGEMCGDCRDEYASSFAGGVCDIFGSCYSENIFSVSEDIFVSVISGSEIYSSDLEKVMAADKSLLCFNYVGEEKIYSDYVKTYAYFNEAGACRYLVVVVNPDEKAALDEKCLEHTFFDVTFISNGEEHNKQSVNYGETPATPEAPAKDGYDFVGWSESDGGEVVELSVVKGEKTYYAIFKIKSYDVTFISDGEEHNRQSVNYGETPATPEAPEKDGYDFVGWSESDGGEVVELSAIKGEKTYYAIFKIKNFDVIFIADGEEHNKQSVNYGETPATPNAPEKEGYDFVGWSESDGGEVVELSAVKGEKTYYAIFKIKSYDVTFISDGEEHNRQSVNYGETPATPEAPAKEGYDFVGWSESDGGEVVELSAIKGEKTYYAIFKIKNFDVIFIADGEEHNKQSVNYGEKPATPEAPEKEGYDFVGWSESDGGEVVELSAIKGEKTYYAIFKIKSYDVTFIADGEEHNKQSVNYGETPATPNAPEKEGYDFVGWSESDGGEVVELSAVKGEKTYYAIFKIKNFDVIFIADGEEHNRQSVNYGETPATPEAPAKEGYDFVGWSESDGGEVVELSAIKGEKTYYAIFKIQTFSVTFISDGEEHNRQSVNYGEAPATPEAPEKDGYDFVGWSESDGGEVVELSAIKGEKTYYAIFKIKSFVVKFVVGRDTHNTQTINYGSTPVPPEDPVHDYGVTFLGWMNVKNGTAENLVTVGEYAITEDTGFYALFENPEDLISIMTKGRNELLTKAMRGTTNTLHKKALNLIAECMRKIIDDATEGIFIDKIYIYDTYPDDASSIKKVIREDMTGDEQSKFSNLLQSTRYVSKNVQDFLIKYFDIDMSKVVN